MKQHTSKQSRDEIMAIMKDYAQKIFDWAERNGEKIPESMKSPWLEVQIELKRNEESKPCILVILTGSEYGFPHNMRNPNKTVFICLDCYNYAPSPPDFFKTMNIIPFEEDTPIYGESLCEVCNEHVHQL